MDSIFNPDIDYSKGTKNDCDILKDKVLAIHELWGEVAKMLEGEEISNDDNPVIVTSNKYIIVNSERETQNIPKQVLKTESIYDSLF